MELSYPAYLNDGYTYFTIGPYIGHPIEDVRFDISSIQQSVYHHHTVSTSKKAWNRILNEKTYYAFYDLVEASLP